MSTKKYKKLLTNAKFDCTLALQPAGVNPISTRTPLMGSRVFPRRPIGLPGIPYRLPKNTKNMSRLHSKCVGGGVALARPCAYRNFTKVSVIPSDSQIDPNPGNLCKPPATPATCACARARARVLPFAMLVS